MPLLDLGSAAPSFLHVTPPPPPPPGSHAIRTHSPRPPHPSAVLSVCA